MKSYFKFLSRNKVYTFINIAGLVVSLMFIILLGDYAWRQYSIDTWHKNADRICLIGSQETFAMWPEAAKQIKDMCPEIEEKCCVMSAKGKIRYHQQEVKDDEYRDGNNDYVSRLYGSPRQMIVKYHGERAKVEDAITQLLKELTGSEIVTEVNSLDRQHRHWYEDNERFLGVLTATLQGWRAATENPVNSIKTE